MTLKEKFGKLFMKGRDTTEFEKIADEFAIGFAEWLNANAYKFPTKRTTKELLEIYKKKGL